MFRVKPARVVRGSIRERGDATALQFDACRRPRAVVEFTDRELATAAAKFLRRNGIARKPLLTFQSTMVQ